MAALHVTEKDFETEVIKSTLPVLVDFWAEWCGPCRMIAPVIDEVAKELAGKIKVVKINIDEAQDLATSFNIMSIPTLLIFKNGKPVEQIVGALPKAQLIAKINAKI